MYDWKLWENTKCQTIKGPEGEKHFQHICMWLWVSMVQILFEQKNVFLLYYLLGFILKIYIKIWSFQKVEKATIKL